MARKPKSIDPAGSPQEVADRPLAVASVAQEAASEPGGSQTYSRSGDLRSVAIDCTQADIEATAGALRHFVAGILRDRHRNHGDGALGMAVVSLDALARIVPTREEPQA